MVILRRQAREWAIQMLTAADLNPTSDVDALIADFWLQLPSIGDEEGGNGGHLPSRKYREFAELRVRGVLQNLTEIDGILNGLLKDWDMQRLGTVERAVLRLGLWELKYSDVPKPVVVNEAIDLANWFSSPRSRSLINGVLDSFRKDA